MVFAVKGLQVLLFNTNISIIISLHTFKGFRILLFNISNSNYQVFLSNVNILHTLVWLQTTNNNNNPL